MSINHIQSSMFIPRHKVQKALTTSSLCLSVLLSLFLCLCHPLVLSFLLSNLFPFVCLCPCCSSPLGSHSKNPFLVHSIFAVLRSACSAGFWLPAVVAILIMALFLSFSCFLVLVLVFVLCLCCCSYLYFELPFPDHQEPKGKFCNP